MSKLLAAMKDICIDLWSTVTNKCRFCGGPLFHYSESISACEHCHKRQ